MKILKPIEIDDPREIVIRTPNDIPKLLREFYEGLFEKEHFGVVALDSGHKVISLRIVSVGTINRTILHPREVFRDAVIDNAAALILCHNHPSGDCSPSKEDLDTTNVLLEASEIIGIELLDHIIISQETYFSFLEHSIIFERKED